MADDRQGIHIVNGNAIASDKKGMYAMAAIPSDNCTASLSSCTCVALGKSKDVIEVFEEA